MSRTRLKPRRIADFPKPYRDTLAHWSALRNIGFSADEIFFGFGPVSGQPDVLHLQLQAQGKTFTVMCATAPGASYVKVCKTWQRLAVLVNTSTMEEREACYREHLIGSNRDYFATFVSAIRAKGIIVPEMIPFDSETAQA